jgi:hypothetical protein
MATEQMFCQFHDRKRWCEFPAFLNKAGPGSRPDACDL